MGRGSSGGQGAGQLSGSPLSAPTTILPPLTPEQIESGDILPQGGVDFSEFEKMSDDEKADVVEDALRVGTPLFLDDSGLQRFAYFTGLKDKPTVVNDSQLDKVKGTEIFRTVNNAYNQKTDIGYTSKDILDQIATGDFTMYSDSGGSAYGKAIYFADNFVSSRVYGGTTSSLMMRAKVSRKNSIDGRSLATNYTQALQRGDKLASACRKAGYDSAENLYALAKGYDSVYDTSSGYHMILNRRCLTVSSTYKDPNGKRQW